MIAYPLFLLAGIVVSFFTWRRLARNDPRLPAIYAAALVCAFAGAKLVYLAAEGWLWWGHPECLMAWLSGKSILGALLGGYAGVEAAKKLTGYTKPTGDLFAVIAPLGILLGRIGCLMHGCCPGVVCEPAWFAAAGADGRPRWPAVPAEMLFNAVALIAVLILRSKRLLPGQHFHLYLMACGVFRFFHEFLRDTPRVLWGFSGYQAAALAVFFLGLCGFLKRQCEGHTNEKIQHAAP